MENTKMRDTREVMRDEMVMRDRIGDILQDAPLTIPEMARRLDRPTREVMLWVMGMRRYGLLIEQGRPDEDGYFKYTLVKSSERAS
jgi:hypothetical protein